MIFLSRSEASLLPDAHVLVILAVVEAPPGHLAEVFSMVSFITPKLCAANAVSGPIFVTPTGLLCQLVDVTKSQMLLDLNNGIAQNFL